MKSKRIYVSALVLICIFDAAVSSQEPGDVISLKNIANVSYAVDKDGLSALASIFSPRMNFDQWKPLTGRGDPLRNDPTYDYEPPVLERVHYWAEDARLEREHYPERKSEVLMLGVSSRKPSVVPRPVPPRRHPRPQVSKYEDFSYKVSEPYPMTILVPPPLPPPGHQPSLYVLTENKIPLPHNQIKSTKLSPLTAYGIKSTTAADHFTTQYTLQEANLIYQSSTTSQNWFDNSNKTKSISSSVSSDYAGWGPTTPLYENEKQNDTHNSLNLITSDNISISKHPYKFYKPMLSEAPPPPPQPTSSSIFLPTFVPTTLPATEATFTQNITQRIVQNNEMNSETTTIPNIVEYYEKPITETIYVNKYQTTENQTPNVKQEESLIDMLSPMMTMPMINGPERLEDNLYAHASENLHVYKENQLNDIKTLETMQPPLPPSIEVAEASTEPQHYHQASNHIIKHFINRKPAKFTHDPYLHMRFTTMVPISDNVRQSDKYKSTSEPPVQEKFLIIQGHSKVKTYSSKPNIVDDNDTINNEISNLNETTEVRHLHPIKEKRIDNNNYIRESRSKNLKSLITDNVGSIEIQEADVGIKYDVSDGSEVPYEIYRRGIVDNDENNYSSKKKQEKRTKRQIDLEELLPFDEDAIEEYVYKFFDDQRNSTGITGFLAQALTTEEGSIIDELVNEDDDSELDEEKR